MAFMNVSQKYLVTAAGPSRNRTGVPCLSVQKVFETDHQHTNPELSVVRVGCQTGRNATSKTQQKI